MKTLLVLSLVSTLALAAPAQAQVLGSGNSGLFGALNNLLSVQTGHISVLDGGILNGSNVLSGIGLGNAALAHDSSVNTSGSHHIVAPGAGNLIARGQRGTTVQGHGNTIVSGQGNALTPGNGNVVGKGNVVGNQWGSNLYDGSFNTYRNPCGC